MTAELPDIVEAELQRRKRDPEALPDPNAVLALRRHFESGHANPSIHGTFISLLEQLGVTPRSDDPLVKDVDCNVVCYERDGEDIVSIWNDAVECHEARVRLFRYGEFVESQQSKGLVLDDGYGFVEHSKVGDGLAITGTCDADGGISKDDSDLTPNQLLALINGFCIGFFQYANHEKVFAGVAHGLQQPIRESDNGMRLFQMDVSQDDILEQCYELRDRYWTQKRPLGPAIANQSSHAASITEKLKLLLSTLELHCTTSPTAASARILYGVANMLEAAVYADPDIARALAMSQEGDPAILRIRDCALERAKEVDSDSSHSDIAADTWWVAYAELTKLAGEIISALTHSYLGTNTYLDRSTPDDALAGKYYVTAVEPALLKSAASDWSSERAPALRALCVAACGVPRELSIALVRDKNKWNLLVGSCSMEACSTITGPPRVIRREERMAPRAAGEATRLLTGLCGRGMKKDDSPTARTPVAPGPLARKMIQRGVVPLMMSLSRSSIDLVSQEAIGGLGQISRVKDCRTLLLQEGSILQFIADMMASSDGNKVSEAMLLVSHLLWDEEWRDPLLSIEPPIETTAIKWAAYSMQCIREDAYKKREEEKKERDDALQAMVSSFLEAQKAGRMEKEQLELHAKETAGALNKVEKWFQLETEQQRGRISNRVLCRAIMMLSTMLHHKDGATRVVSAGGIALAAACIDVPLSDTHLGAITLLKNISGARVLSTSLLPDPEHVARSMLMRVCKMADAQANYSLQLVALMQLVSFMCRSAEWLPYIDAIAEKYPEAKFAIERMPMFAPAHHGSSDDETDSPRGSWGVHEGLL